MPNTNKKLLICKRLLNKLEKEWLEEWLSSKNKNRRDE
jgi:hypothetical protein